LRKSTSPLALNLENYVPFSKSHKRISDYFELVAINIKFSEKAPQ